jgi:hypothetical protein
LGMLAEIQRGNGLRVAGPSLVAACPIARLASN